jgi:hypothetical protein
MTNIVPETKAVSALLPDGSSMTGNLVIYPGGFRVFVNPWHESKELPVGVILIPFNGATFVVHPEYAEALQEGLGEKLAEALPKRTAMEILHHCKVLQGRLEEALV